MFSPKYLSRGSGSQGECQGHGLGGQRSSGRRVGESKKCLNVLKLIVKKQSKIYNDFYNILEIVFISHYDYDLYYI